MLQAQLGLPQCAMKFQLNKLADHNPAGFANQELWRSTSIYPRKVARNLLHVTVQQAKHTRPLRGLATNTRRSSNSATDSTAFGIRSGLLLTIRHGHALGMMQTCLNFRYKCRPSASTLRYTAVYRRESFRRGCRPGRQAQRKHHTRCESAQDEKQARSEGMPFCQPSKAYSCTAEMPMSLPADQSSEARSSIITQITRPTGSNAQPKFSDPAQTVVWGGQLPNRRRFVTGTLTGLGIGIASALLHCQADFSYCTPSSLYSL